MVTELSPPVLGVGATKINTGEGWLAHRPELITLFEDHVYGFTPELELRQDWQVHQRQTILDGRAERIQIDLTLASDRGKRVVHLLLYIPAGEANPGAPTFIGLNFDGNQTVDPDPVIRPVRDSQVPPGGWPEAKVAAVETRGSRSHSWPVEQIIEAGCALATAYAGDFEPDHPDAAGQGVRSLWGERAPQRQPSDWGTLGVWAWGLSRMRETVAEHRGVDPARTIAIGHSRMGKAALWAAAQDENFAMAVSNESGCGGAAPSRRPVGERLHDITTTFPHWFSPRFATYAGRETELPIDQHQLLASIAPRELYVASAREDQWSDPEGEHLSSLAAAPAFELFGKPAPAVGYHLRDGVHALLPEDWGHYLAYANERLLLASS